MWKIYQKGDRYRIGREVPEVIELAQSCEMITKTEWHEAPYGIFETTWLKEAREQRAFLNDTTSWKVVEDD